MKYLKRFETINDTFIIGDVVTTLPNNEFVGDTNVFAGLTGRIIKYHSGSRHDYDIKFNEFDEINWLRYNEIRFATPEEIKKFELIEKSQNYNL